MGLRGGGCMYKFSSTFIMYSLKLVFTILFVFQCPWPINSDEITFFQRNALTCDWNEELLPPIGIPEENLPMSIELLLYTPPVTPSGELSKESTDSASTECSLNPSSGNKLDEILVRNKVTHSTKESTSSLPVLEPNKLENNNIEGRRDDTKEENASVCKSLPKIVNIEKTHFNLTFSSKSDDSCSNKKIHNYLPIEATMMDKTTLSNNTLCKEINLDRKCEIGKEQSNDSKFQLNNEMNDAETNLSTEMLEPDKQFDASDTNNLSTTNNSSSQISDVSSNIDQMLDDILSTGNHVTENIGSDWLDSLFDI